jgi:hypothetical protein
MFHVDSRKNLLYRARLFFSFFQSRGCLWLSAVKSDWHTAFDAGQWILFPDAATLVEVYRYIESALAWREDPASARVEDFTTKVRLLLMPKIFRH